MKCWRSEAEICVSSWFFPSCDFALRWVLATDYHGKNKKVRQMKLIESSLAWTQGWRGPLGYRTYSHRGELTQESLPLTRYMNPQVLPTHTLGLRFAAQLFPTLCNPLDCQAPLSMEFSRQEYWRGCHAILQGTFLTQGLNPCLLYYSWMLYLLSITEAKVVKAKRSGFWCETLPQTSDKRLTQA